MAVHSLSQRNIITAIAINIIHLEAETNARISDIILCVTTISISENSSNILKKNISLFSDESSFIADSLHAELNTFIAVLPIAGILLAAECKPAAKQPLF